MNRTTIVKVLEFLKTKLSEDQISLDSIQHLEIKINELNFETKKLEIPSQMPIPTEISNLKAGTIFFADGACRGNPGPGSWACIAHDFKGEILLKASGIDLITTNNKMELTGAIESLRWAKENCAQNTPIYFFSDSKYVIEGKEKWVPGWKERGWKKADNKSPENLEFWKELDQLLLCFSEIKFFWVKGHAGIIQNEICDKMANEALNEAGY